MRTQQKTPLIDVCKLMKQTNYGRDIYEMIIPGLELEDAYRFKNAMNPFYPDKNPSLSIYKGKTWWLYNDFGDSTFSGDALDIAARHYHLSRKGNFSDILRHLVEDLKIDPKLVAKDIDTRVFRAGYSLNGEWRQDESGLEIAYGFFKDFGISKSVLKRYGVRAVKHLWEVGEKGNAYVRYFPKDEIVIAYEDINHTKLYTPGAEKHIKFRYLGRKPEDFIFGVSQITTDMRLTKNYDRGPLIITGGEKDVLTLASLGYDAISLNSETAKIPAHLTDGLFLAYDKIILLYDIDETGKVNATKRALEHNLLMCVLPYDLISKGGKDVSDYIKLGMSVAVLHELIDSSAIPEPLTGSPDPILSQNSLTELPDSIVSDEGKTEIKTEICRDPITPLIPDEVYTLLPQSLQSMCNKFEDKRERDVCLLSCITVMSSCFPFVKGVYDSKDLGCNINLFITAPASAGKGIMTWSRFLGKAIHSHLKEQYKRDYSQYESDLAEYTKDKTSRDKPMPPKQKLFFIPANSSSSSLIECLDANENFGVMFDTEGDTLSSTLKNEWANFSHVIRQAFHHEEASLKRRGNNEYREVENPHLSILLSGTRNQVTRLIDSVEDGLFSRFVFYDFDFQLIWKDKFGKRKDSMKEFFNMHGEQLLKYWNKGTESGEILYELSDEQREPIRKYFTDKFNYLLSIYGEDIVGNVRRTCIIYYRIAMILSALKYFELINLKVNKVPKTMTISEDQSKCAFLIVDTLLSHLEFVFTRIQRTGAVSKLNFKQRSLYEALPKEFTWQEFVTLASEQEIIQSTAEKYKRDFSKLKLIVPLEHGRYKKI